MRLTRIAGPEAAEVWVKLEAANPTGSYKDRMALAMIEGAERSGRLRPGQTVVEYTGGSTGSSLAFVCAVKGYPTRIVTSDAFAAEKLATMRAFGATLDVLPSPEGITPQLIPAMRERALAIAEEIGGFRTDQFHNHDMLDRLPRAGRGDPRPARRRVDAWVSYVGTAGCFLGVGGTLRERLPGVRRVAVEPAESAVLSGRPAGTHRIEGGGIGFVPPLLDVARDVDEVRPVPQDEAFAMARRAAREEGVWSGPSTGANLVAAIAVARELGRGQRVVTVAVDSGMKYLGGPLYRQGTEDARPRVRQRGAARPAASISSRSCRAVRPLAVTSMARLVSIRRTQPRSWSRLQIWAPAAPARWGRRSVQSTHTRTSGRRAPRSASTSMASSCRSHSSRPGSATPPVRSIRPLRVWRRRWPRRCGLRGGRSACAHPRARARR